MSYTTGYYISMFIGAMGGLAWLAMLASVPLAGYLIIQGKILSQQQKPSDEPLGALVDWTNGGKMVKQGILVITVAFPLLYILSHMIPDPRTAMNHLGFDQDPWCMKPDESGELIEGTSINNAMYATFKMKDGVAVMCRIDGMNARGTLKHIRYSVTQGRLVS